MCRVPGVLAPPTDLLALVASAAPWPHGVLEGGRVAGPHGPDPQTVAWREMARMIRDDETLLPAVLPVAAGLLLATKRA